MPSLCVWGVVVRRGLGWSVMVAAALASATVARAQELVESGQVIVMAKGPIVTLPATNKTTTARMGADIARREAGSASAVLRMIEATGEVIVRTPAGRSDADFARALMLRPGVLYAQPDWICAPAETVPDPLAAQQWHLVRSEVPQAWAMLDERVPSDGAYRPIVAIVDSGVDLTHPDLSGILVSGFNSVGIGRAQALGGAVDDVGTTGHGTRCAGVSVAGVNNGVGVAGVASRARLMPLRCTDNPGGSALLSDILNGVRWASDNGADIISVSYWGVDNPSVQTSALYARERGGVVLWAAGNSGRAVNRVNDLWPVLVVGATNRVDDRLTSSTFGAAIDLTAPGEALLTTARGGQYTTSSGTSFATPMAAGVAAMIRAANPTMPPDRVAEVLLASADDLGSPGRDDLFGGGRVNAARGVAMALADSIALLPLMRRWSARGGSCASCRSRRALRQRLRTLSAMACSRVAQRYGRGSTRGSLTCRRRRRDSWRCGSTGWCVWSRPVRDRPVQGRRWLSSILWASDRRSCASAGASWQR